MIQCLTRGAGADIAEEFKMFPREDTSTIFPLMLFCSLQKVLRKHLCIFLCTSHCEAESSSNIFIRATVVQERSPFLPFPNDGGKKTGREKVMGEKDGIPGHQHLE